jgi:hypothetical protein
VKYRKPQTLEEHIASQEQLLHHSWVVFYLAAFYNFDTRDLDFCKYGVTSEKNALLRFINHKWPDRTYQYRHWKIEIICEVKMPPRDALTCEWNAQQRYPKDIWIEEYFKGAGEIFKFPVDVPDFFLKNKSRFQELKKEWSEFNVT